MKDNRHKALTASHKRGTPKKQLTCHFCKKPGHFYKRNCGKLAQVKMNEKLDMSKHSASKAATKEQVYSSTSDDEALVTIHSLISASSRETLDHRLRSHVSYVQ